MNDPICFPALPPQQLVTLNDPASGLEGLIVIHSTKLGPAVGGCRLWQYGSSAEAANDALRLAEGMTYKNALAGLPLGGGKAVIRRAEEFSREALFRAFGRAIERLDGAYVTAEDVGTCVADMEVVARETQHVAGLSARPGEAGGDPSPWTALGVFRAMEVAVRRRFRTSISDMTVAVQGLGHVGFALCELLHDAGAKLIVAEPRSDVAARAAVLFNAEVMGVGTIIGARADVFAPCALGGIINEAAISRLRAKVVCGAANNQLASPAQGDQLAGRGILYAPDYVANAGGIINVAAEHLGWSAETARDQVNKIGIRMGEILDLAHAGAIAPSRAADKLAGSIVASKERFAEAA
jgi:leucine dehydrogenase